MMLFTKKYSDKELVERVVSDDRYFDDIYIKYFDTIYRFVAWRCDDKNTVQDIVSEVFMIAFQKINDLDTTKDVHLSAWLSRIAYLKLWEYYKSIVYDTTIWGDDYDLYDESYESMQTMVEYDHVINMIWSLPINQAKIMYLRYMDGYTNKEISAITDLKEKTISGILSKAVSHLQNKIS